MNNTKNNDKVATVHGMIKSMRPNPIPASPIANPFIVATNAPALPNKPVRREKAEKISKTSS